MRPGAGPPLLAPAAAPVSLPPPALSVDRVNALIRYHELVLRELLPPSDEIGDEPIFSLFPT